MGVTIYGIRNCDTMRKARSWLDSHGVAYLFHDYKVAGIDRARLERWCDELGWEALVNRSGTTFRRLPDVDKEGMDRKRAIGLMLTHPSTIRRPVLELDGSLLVGFDARRYAGMFEPAR